MIDPEDNEFDDDAFNLSIDMTFTGIETGGEFEGLADQESPEMIIRNLPMLDKQKRMPHVLDAKPVSYKWHVGGAG